MKPAYFHERCQKSIIPQLSIVLCLILLIMLVLVVIRSLSQTSYIATSSDLQRLISLKALFSATSDDSTNQNQTEIAISHSSIRNHVKFSKFRCSGSENDITAFEGRLCVFNNLCYSTVSRHFYYYRSSKTHKRPLFYDASKKMLFQFNENNTASGFLSLSAGGTMPWAPIIHDKPYPTRSVTFLHHLHSLIKIRYANDNIAHGLWEDLGSVSYSLERMNIEDSELVVLHYDTIPQSPLMTLYNRYVMKALSKYPIMELQTYAKSLKTEYVCFKNLIVGGQLDVFPRERILENHGRERLFYNWRSKIIRSNGLDPHYVPVKHKIIITNKSQSVWTHPAAKLHRAIVNLEELEIFVRNNYRNTSVEVVEWHKLTFKEQIEKLMRTTILITPCGGVSLIIPFLPHGAHAIVMDYYVNVDDRGFFVGQSASMEGAFLNHIPHVRKQYYQLYGTADFEFDFPGGTNSREESSVVVNMTRLQMLIDKALEEMEP